MTTCNRLAQAPQTSASIDVDAKLAPLSEPQGGFWCIATRSTDRCKQLIHEGVGGRGSTSQHDLATRAGTDCVAHVPCHGRRVEGPGASTMSFVQQRSEDSQRWQKKSSCCPSSNALTVGLTTTVEWRLKEVCNFPPSQFPRQCPTTPTTTSLTHVGLDLLWPTLAATSLRICYRLRPRPTLTTCTGS